MIMKGLKIMNKHVAVISAQSTDLASNGGQILDLGIIICDAFDYTEKDRLELLIKPDGDVSPFAEAANTKDLTEKARTQGDDTGIAFSKLWHFLSKYVDIQNPGASGIPLCGHNIPHTVGLLRNFSNKAGFPNFMGCVSPFYRDSMMLSAILNEASFQFNDCPVYFVAGDATASSAFPIICECEEVSAYYTSSMEKADTLKLLWMKMVGNISDMIKNDSYQNNPMEEGVRCPNCGCKTEEDIAYPHKDVAVKVKCIVCGEEHVIQKV